MIRILSKTSLLRPALSKIWSLTGDHLKYIGYIKPVHSFLCCFRWFCSPDYDSFVFFPIYFVVGKKRIRRICRITKSPTALTSGKSGKKIFCIRKNIVLANQSINRSQSVVRWHVSLAGAGGVAFLWLCQLRVTTRLLCCCGGVCSLTQLNYPGPLRAREFELVFFPLSPLPTQVRLRVGTTDTFLDYQNRHF